MRTAFLVAICVVGISPRWGLASELKVLPAEVRLTGPQASQRLLVLAEENGKVVGDRTSLARFTSSDEAVVKIDARGVVQAVGDGEATITARQDGKTVTAKVKVKGAKGETAWSFRNDVIPLLTKVGCNSGACHGALAGKGGFKITSS